MIFCSAKLQNKLDIRIFSFLFCADFAFSCIALSALTLTSTCMCILLKLLFINDIPINVNTTPVGDVALFAADADSALCDCSGDLC